MFGQKYKQKKIAVLDFWRRYRTNRGSTDDGVDLEHYEQRATALEEGKYILAVVGETKAGKSTFINALLGERILPTDVLQSSNAIIEIFKSTRKYVEVRYADGHVEQVEDDPNTPEVDAAFECLRRVGSIQDCFRTIPTTLIDTFIIDGRIKLGGPIPFSELESTSKLPLKGREELIEAYVKERSLAQIPDEIRIGFPLKYDFDELRLVDTPGVNALGGVQDKTFNYLYKANAVIFIHSMEGPVENSSFRDFVTRVITNRTKEALFLVLSKSGTKSEIEIDAKIRDATSVYEQVFDSGRILHADSMLKIISEEILKFDTIGDLKAHYVAQKGHFERLYKREGREDWRDEATIYQKKAELLTNALNWMGSNTDREAIRDKLFRLSNFEHIETVLDKFAMSAPELQLMDFLVAIKRGYDNQISAYEQRIDLLEKKSKAPQTFKNEISQVRGLLAKYQLSMNEFVEQTRAEYAGTRAKYRPRLEQIKSRYQQEVQAAGDRAMARKALGEFYDSNLGFIDEVAREVRNKFARELTRLGKEFKSEHSITVPTIDVNAIEAKAKDGALRDAEVETDPTGFWETAWHWITFKTWKPKIIKKVFDESQSLSNFRNEAAIQIDSLVSKNYKLISDLLDNFTADFKRALQSLMDERGKALDGLQESDAMNDRILADIAATKERKEEISAEVNQANEMLENLR